MCQYIKIKKFSVVCCEIQKQNRNSSNDLRSSKWWSNKDKNYVQSISKLCTVKGISFCAHRKQFIGVLGRLSDLQDYRKRIKLSKNAQRNWRASTDITKTGKMT